MELTEFTKKNSPKLRKYKKYLVETDWTKIEVLSWVQEGKKKEHKLNYEETLKQRTSEYRTQEKIVQTALERLKYLVKKYKTEKSKSPYGTFIKLTKGIIDLHLDRCYRYENEVDILEISDSDYRSKEVDFQNSIFKNNSKLTESLTEINLSTEEGSDDVVEFYNDMKAPLIMHYTLSEIYPSINEKIKSLGVDFEKEPEPTLFINDPNPPKWDSKKHYFEQDKKTLQYYIDEWNKMRNGIVIDGVYISPWMYYHINFFVTKYPTVVYNEKSGNFESKDVIDTPPLRDNEWWVINDNYEKAKKEGKMMFLAATRRAAKTTILTSHLGSCIIQNKLNLLVAGGSSKDIDQIKTNFTLLQRHIHEAFRVTTMIDDWEKFVEIGIKSKLNKSIKASIIKVINMDGGASTKSEIFAGFTPDAAIIDEIMKLSFKEQLEGLKPAIDTPYGKRCVVILSGTAGNSTLAKDAFEVLREPDLYDILEMPWDLLNKRVPEDCRTWTERPFGTFIPAQMSAKDGMVKEDSDLSEYLNVKSEGLKNISIKTTNWREAKRKIQTDRAVKKKDLEAYTKEVLYYPLCPSDMLLSTEINPFPVQEAISHREYLKSIGGAGRKGYLVQGKDGHIKFELSENTLAEYPHKGGTVDAPVVLYEPIPETKPVDYLYVAGLDDVAHEDSGTDSVSSFHIYKVDVGIDKNCGKIVASYASRPQPREKFHQQIYLLQQAFNAKCFMENADLAYKDYLERRRVADRWLMTALDFDSDLSVQSEGRRKYGWAPTAKNKQNLFQKALHYGRRPFDSEDEDGNFIELLGVQMIDDLGLLDEIIAYRKGNNVDRITSFMSCLAYEDYLRANYMLYDPTRDILKTREENKEKIKKTNKTPFFTGKRGKFF